jgi:transposase
MAKRTRQSLPSSAGNQPRRQPVRPMLDSLQVSNPHAAGIDIHLAEHWVAVPLASAPPPPRDHPANLPPNVRRFGTNTADLEELADWLTACAVTTVAMESTGIYYVPLFELLELGRARSSRGSHL